MKILVAHNFYQYQGGEDSVFSNEKLLLQRYGNEVIEYVRHNRDISTYGIPQFVTLPARTLWNWDSYTQVKELLKQHKPDVAHFHNIFPLISPAAYDACWDCNVPVVQTLHNSRLFCPSGGLFYRGEYCQKCLGKTLPWAGILRGCYRDSHVQTGMVGIMSAIHKRRGTWMERVSRYVVFNTFFREKFIQAGLPADKLTIKPHFLDDPGHRNSEGEYALYVGRLSEPKGVQTLIRAWESVSHVPLKICGSGPLDEQVTACAANSGGKVELIPFAPHERVFELMKKAAFLVWPSEAVESFGLVALEAFACGLPVVSSGLGAMSELVTQDQTGINFRAGDPADLAEKIAWSWEHKAEMARMGVAARQRYETYYSAEKNYSQLLQIYREAIEQRRLDSNPASPNHNSNRTH